MEEYVIDSNGRQAAIRAGYSPRSARRNAQFLLRSPAIADAVAAKQAELAARASTDAERVLREAAYLGFADIGEILDFSGGTLRLRPPEDIPEHARRAIQSIKVRRYTEGRGEDAREVELTEFKLHDKRSALELVAKLIGALTDRVDHSGTVRHEHYDARVPLTDEERRNRIAVLLARSRN